MTWQTNNANKSNSFSYSSSNANVSKKSGGFSFKYKKINKDKSKNVSEVKGESMRRRVRKNGKSEKQGWRGKDENMKRTRKLIDSGVKIFGGRPTLDFRHNSYVV